MEAGSEVSKGFSLAGAGDVVGVSAGVIFITIDVVCWIQPRYVCVYVCVRAHVRVHSHTGGRMQFGEGATFCFADV
eukprot:1142067-Pelagomonas_calceolata.AAC.2